jgi:TatD DNase family protein
MRWVDSHCHLDYDYAPKSSTDIIREASEVGVETLITIGVEVSHISTIQKISESHSNVFHSIGFHPHEAIDFRPEYRALMQAALQHPKCVALGEVGLDYYYDHSPRETQIRVLETLLELALVEKKPVIIHSRDGEEDLLPKIREFSSSWNRDWGPPGVIHCFTGTRAFGESCLELGWKISFSGILTFKNSVSIQECARDFPLDQLLVETDSPYLAPIPHRGKKCEPRMVVETGKKLAELKGLSIEEVAEATTLNAGRLFKLPKA